MRYCWLIVLNCWAVTSVVAQNYTEVFGKVVDASTKEPMDYVNVQFKGTTRTTLTDHKGEYRLRASEKADTIVFSYIGYKTRVIPVKRGAVQELNVEMGSEGLQLKEVTISAKEKKRKRVIDTTANYVYYQVLKHKDQNREGAVNSYHYEAYEKLCISLLNPPQKFLNKRIFRPFSFAFRNTDTTEQGNIFIPGVVRETVSEVYYRRNPKSVKRFVKADVMTGIDEPSILELATFQLEEQDVYGNIITVANTPFIAPFSNTAILTYFYYLTDTVLLDGRISYKLHFVGKVKEDLALKGYAWIDSATWAIRSIYFRPNEKSNLNFVADYSVKQDFTLVNNRYWILNRDEMYGVGSLFKKERNKLSILVNKVMNRRNIDINIAIPDSVFKGPDEKIMLDTLRINRKPFFDTTRFEPLTPQENEVWHISDTIRLVPAWKMYQWTAILLTTAYATAGPISIGKLLNFVSRNNVEGWRLRFGIETNSAYKYFGWKDRNRFLRKFYFTGYVAYGLKDRDLKYMVLSRINLPRRNNRWQSLEFMYRYDMVVPGQDPNNTLLTFDNFVTIISGQILSKVMKVSNFQISYEKEYFRGFSAITGFSEKVFHNIPGVLDFAVKRGDVWKPIRSFNVTEFFIDTRYSYRDQYVVGVFYRYFQNSRWPVFMLRYTAGLVNMDRDYFNYHNFHFTIRQRVSTRVGYTYYTIRAAKIFGRVPYTAAYLTQGNLGILLDKFNYNLLRQFEFVSDQYLSVWVAHHFNGFFFNKIPYMKKLRFREVVFMRSLVGTFSEKNRSVLRVPEELGNPGPVPYVEMGFGIENIAYIMRLDFLWRLTYRNMGGPNWGIKFAISPRF
ncbi:MAG: DUF5686 and carboxypeptidase regulatory-like domain-containing protein [Chitinophagales bacterium]|nr:DUF5686 and carboxypeptidase regulatory-like domain-containing protein [Chitinophagales bacterium]MDW8418092.1 DUF5686 family protein [Chitinophagales bacterium]